MTKIVDELKILLASSIGDLIYLTLSKNKEKINDREYVDILFSTLLMINIEVLSRVISSENKEENMDQFFKRFIDEVSARVKERIKNKDINS